MVGVALSRPDARFRDSFLDAAAEFGNEPTLAYEREMAERNFDSYVRDVERWSRGQRLPSGWVAFTTMWLTEGDSYIGTVNIRHELTEWLRRYGGHIGYAVRPTMRRRGYGTTMCALALDEARRIGLRRVLITCDDDNIGSARIIEVNGGVLEDSVPQPDRPVLKRRYWIDL